MADSHIPPLRDVNLQLQKHKFSIDQIREAIPGLSEFDDTFVLRFLLSAKGDVGKAENAINSTLRFRLEKAEYMKVNWIRYTGR